MQFLTIFSILFAALTTLNAQNLYFPPLTGNVWQTQSPQSLGWKDSEIPILYDFLEQTNTKAFIVLKDGKIVLEKYFGTFTQDSLWYWASAGKTATSFLVGMAQAEGKLSIKDKTSKYLGKGWTSLTESQEDAITIWHQLTMTSGLDDTNDKDCTTPNCLIYKAEAGKRWAYHNAPYTLLDKVIEKATGVPFNQYYTTKLKAKIGMNGLFIKSGFNNVNYSNARSFARFGLLMLNKGKWNNEQILPLDFFNEATNTSQNLNLSYGYLWWLNGKASFMLPTLQNVFNGNLVKDAPADMYSAMGKNGQIINIVPSMNLVMIRMGNDDGTPVPTTYNNEIWKHFNKILPQTGSKEINIDDSMSIFPNPTDNTLFLRSDLIDVTNVRLSLFDALGKVYFLDNQNDVIDLSSFPNGCYNLKIEHEGLCFLKRIMIMR
jgi:CubicO group peptidase (beta-lactamase class C family)